MKTMEAGGPHPPHGRPQRARPPQFDPDIAGARCLHANGSVAQVNFLELCRVMEDAINQCNVHPQVEVQVADGTIRALVALLVACINAAGFISSVNQSTIATVVNPTHGIFSNICWELSPKCALWLARPPNNRSHRMILKRQQLHGVARLG